MAAGGEAFSFLYVMGFGEGEERRQVGGVVGDAVTVCG